MILWCNSKLPIICLSFTCLHILVSLIIINHKYAIKFVASTSIMPHPLISQNPRERVFLVQISLLIVKFISLISWDLPLTQTTPKNSTHTLELHHVSAFFELDQCLAKAMEAKYSIWQWKYLVAIGMQCF